MPNKLAIFNAGTLLLATVMAGQPNRAANREQNPAANSQPAITLANRKDEQSDSQHNQPKSSSDSPSRNAALKWPAWLHDSSWWLVIIAGITGAFICWQSWETRKAAQSGIARERARLVIHVDKGGPQIGPQEGIADGFHPVEVRVFVVNDGATKAFNVKAFGDLSIAREPEGTKWKEGDMREIPRTISNADAPIPLVVSGIEFESKLEGVSGSSADYFSPIFIEEIKRGTCFIQAHGIIRYEDIFGKTRKTPFRLIWKPAGGMAGKEWPEGWEWSDISPKST